MIAKTSQGKKGKGCLKGCLTLIVLLVLFFGGLEVFRRVMVKRLDETYLQRYKPLPEIADIAEKTTLTDTAKKIFYRADPEYIGQDKFVTYCASGGVELALACARSDTPDDKERKGARIFLLAITDPEFVDSKYPSAAHELLHIGYQKFSISEKKRVGELIDRELANHQDDPHLTGIVDIIKKAKSNWQEEARNELHSIFGTEYRNLLPELETHYSQYFSDRNSLVAMHEKSGLTKGIRKLSELQNELNDLDAQLTELSGRLYSYKNSGNSSDYNALIPQFNNLVNQYNAKVSEGKSVFEGIK